MARYAHTKMTILCGIDYSMTCPAMVVCHGTFHIDNCKFYYLIDTKCYQGIFCGGKVIGKQLPKLWSSQEERFDLLSDFFMKILEQYDPQNVKMMIEGYAMSAGGLVFNIGENTGLLKHKLYKKSFPFDVIAPTRVKKLATSKGT